MASVTDIPTGTWRAFCQVSNTASTAIRWLQLSRAWGEFDLLFDLNQIGVTLRRVRGPQPIQAPYEDRNPAMLSSCDHRLTTSPGVFDIWRWPTVLW